MHKGLKNNEILFSCNTNANRSTDIPLATAVASELSILVLHSAFGMDPDKLGRLE